MEIVPLQWTPTVIGQMEAFFMPDSYLDAKMLDFVFVILGA